MEQLDFIQNYFLHVMGIERSNLGTGLADLTGLTVIGSTGYYKCLQ